MSPVTDWWADFFWDRKRKDKAAFRRGYALGFISAIIIVSMTSGLTGCSTIDPNNRVAGWPEMKVVEQKVSFDEVQDQCRRFVGWGQWPMACAIFYFQSARCHIFYAFDWALEHERMHCLGYDHPGDTSMREALQRFKASQH